MSCEKVEKNRFRIDYTNLFLKSLIYTVIVTKNIFQCTLATANQLVPNILGV